MPMGYMPVRRDDEDMVTYLRRARREMKELEEEFKSEKKEDKKRSGKGLSAVDIFLILTLASPIIGPLYMYAVIAGARHISEMLSATLH